MNSMGTMQTLPYRFKCVNQRESQEYTHLMGVRVTRSNKPVWVVGSRAMTHNSHPWPDGLMGRSHFVGEVQNGSIPGCERTEEVGDYTKKK